ncbi:fatty acid binding protein 7, brain, a [Symphorus nematophorus]
MVDAFCGTWKLVGSQNFDDYMKALGVGSATRQIETTRPTITISQDGDKVVIENQSTFRCTKISSKLGEEFEFTPDNQVTKSVLTMEGDKLVQVQELNSRENKLVREIKDGKMVMTLTLGEIQAVCIYEKA